jgi:cell wall-associated NlpC family hydrolase
MSRLVARARTFLGVPYRHRGRTAAGLDCAGLPWLAYAEEGVILPDLKKYGRTPFDDGLMRAAADALGDPVWTGVVGQVVPSELLQVGDVCVLRFVLEPHHMAIVGDDEMYGLSLIHANGQPGISRVVEQGLTEDFLKMIAAVFRRPV